MKQRWAIITGASSGLGQEFARQLDQRDDIDCFLLVARRKDRLEALAAELKHCAEILPLDLMQPESESAVMAALPEAAVVSHLVLAAGFGIIGAVGEIASSQSAGMIDLNCRLLTLLMEACLTRYADGAEIYPIASVAAFLPQPEFAVYAATKAYVLSYARGFAHELRARQKQLKVVIVCPGPMETEFFDIAGAKQPNQSQRIKSIGLEKVDRVVAKALKRGFGKGGVSVVSWSSRFIRLVSRVLPHKLILAIEMSIGLYK